MLARITPRSASLIALFIAVLVLPAPAREKDFVMPQVVAAATMAAHDAHPSEKLTLGADPYDTATKAALFRLKMREHNVLPVLIVFTNDSNETVLLSHVRFELVTRDHAKAEPYSFEDLQRAFTHLRPPDSRAQDKIPLPLPGKNKAHGGLSQQDRDDLEHAMFFAHAVEPHTSQQGFLFFDSGDLDDPAQGARLFVTGVKDSHGHELMYFEVPLK
jgi:hypothetical protein